MNARPDLSTTNTDAVVPGRWSVRGIIAYAALIGVTAAGYALVIVAFDAAIKTGT